MSHDIIDTTNAAFENAKSALTALYVSKKELKVEIRRVETGLKYRPNDEKEAELEGMISAIVELDIAIEDARSVVEAAEKDKQQAAVTIMEAELVETSKSIQIDLGFSIEDNAELAARLLGSMASSIQYSLESGQPYFIRLTQKVYNRTFGSNNEAGSEDGMGEFGRGSEDQLAALTEERSMQKAYMFALKREYDTAYACRDTNKSWFPKFLNRTNKQVGSQIAEREAKRYEAFAASQVALKKETAKHLAATDVTPEFH